MQRDPARLSPGDLRRREARQKNEQKVKALMEAEPSSRKLISIHIDVTTPADPSV
jgi:hypothetical protein